MIADQHILSWKKWTARPTGVLPAVILLACAVPPAVGAGEPPPAPRPGHTAWQQDLRVLPYLQNPARDGMTITWFSHELEPGSLEVWELEPEPDESAPATAIQAVQIIFQARSIPRAMPELRYAPGEIADLAEPVEDLEISPAWRHRVRVEPLRAGRWYGYRVAQGATRVTGRFHTAPEPTEPVEFAVYADSETEPESAGKLAQWTAPDQGGRPFLMPEEYVVDQQTGYRENLKILAANRPDFIAVAGDLVEIGGEQRDWDEFWRHNAGEMGNLAGSIPLVAALGNHENRGSRGFEPAGADRATKKFHAYFETPRNGARDPWHHGRYHRLDYGKVTLITLDSSDGLPHGNPARDTNHRLEPGSNAPDFNPGSEQWQWARAQLADAAAADQLIFVQFHHAPYSSGPHGVVGSSQSGVPMRQYSRLFAQYGVIAVFSGHDEMYERGLREGVHYYDVGIGGDGLRAPRSATMNYFGQFLAHRDQPEVWEGPRLISGGKHYGHLRVRVDPPTSQAVARGDLTWHVTLEPVIAFPLMNGSGHVTGFEERLYDDVVTVSRPPRNYRQWATRFARRYGLPEEALKRAPQNLPTW